MNKNLKLFYISNISNTLGNLVYPLITYILLKTLHIDDAYIGFYTMIITLCRIPGIIIGGQLGDIYDKRKPFLAALLLIASGSMMFISIFYLNKRFVIICLLCLSKFLSGMSSPLSTKILAILSDKDKKSGFANYYWITNFGAAFASLVGGYIFSYSASLIFVIDGLTRIISGLILMNVDDTKDYHIKEVSDNGDENTNSKILAYIGGKPHVIIYIAFLLIFTFVYSQYSYAIPLKLEKDFVNAQSSRIYSIILFINCLSVILLTKIFQKLWEKRHEILCISDAFLFLTIGFGAYVLKLNIIIIVFSTLLWSFGEILFGMNELIYISNNVDKQYFARVVSFYDSIRNIVIAIAPFLSNLIVTNASIEASWFVMTLLTFFAFILMKIFNIHIINTTALADS